MPTHSASSSNSSGLSNTMPARRSEIPAHLALDRPQALDDHDDLLADAIFLDRLDLHPAERNVVHVDACNRLADPDRGLAGISRRGGRGRKPWRGLRPASSSPRSTFWSNLKPTMPSRIQTTVAGIFCDDSSIATCSPTVGGVATIGHQAAGRQVLDPDQLLARRQRRSACRRAASAKRARRRGARPAAAPRSTAKRWSIRTRRRLPPRSARRTSCGSAIRTCVSVSRRARNRAKMGLYGQHG